MWSSNLGAWCGRRLLTDQFCCVSEFSFSPFFFFCAHFFLHYLFAADQRLCLIDHGFFLGLSFFNFFWWGVLLCVIKFSSCNRSVVCYHFWKFVSFLIFLKATGVGGDGVVEVVAIIIHSCKFWGFKPTGRSLRNNYVGRAWRECFFTHLSFCGWIGKWVGLCPHLIYFSSHLCSYDSCMSMSVSGSDMRK